MTSSSPAIQKAPCCVCNRVRKLMPSGLCAWCHHDAVAAEPQPAIEPFSPPIDPNGDDDDFAPEGVGADDPRPEPRSKDGYTGRRF